jgi:hypothetical protein
MFLSFLAIQENYLVYELDNTIIVTISLKLIIFSVASY